MELHIRDCEKFPNVSMRKVIDDILINDGLYQKIGLYIDHILNAEMLPNDPSTDEISESISKIANKVSDTINQSIDNLFIEKEIDPNFDFEKRCKNIITAVIDMYFTDPDITIYINGYSTKYMCDECKGYITYMPIIRKDENGKYVIGKFDSEAPHDFIVHGYAEDLIYDIVMDCDGYASISFNHDIYNFEFRDFCPSTDKKKEYIVL